MNYKLLIILALVMFSFGGYAQMNGTIGFKASVDRQFFIYDDLKGDNVDVFPDFSIGADASLQLTEKIRVRAELKYANVSYTRYYNTTDDNPENIKYTKLQINNMDINPYVDFKLFSIASKFDIFYTFGMKLEFNLGERQRSVAYDGNKNKDWYINGDRDEHKDAMLGSGTGFIFKYNVNDHLGITVFPEVSIFYGEYYEKNNMHYMRGSVNVGVEWAF